MKDHLEENEVIEARDPVAHPHYPRRLATARHPTFRIVAEEEREEATENVLSPE